MVLKPRDINHLSLMADLSNQPGKEPNPKDFLPTISSSSLENSLMKLCSGLRTNGFNQYADSLENKFVMLKKAEVHMYNVHDETGEDLVEQAHPEGDHNVEDGELGDVETIVSQSNKDRKVVEKQPTGKLGEIVRQCIIVLGQAAAVKPVTPATGDDEAKKKVEAERIKATDGVALQNAVFLEATVNGSAHLSASWPHFATYMALLKSNLTAATKTPDADALQSAAENLEGLMQALDPKFDWSSILYSLVPMTALYGVYNVFRTLFGGVSENMIKKVSGIAITIGRAIKQSFIAASKYNDLTTPQAKPGSSGNSAGIVDTIQTLTATDIEEKQKELMPQLANLKTKWQEKATANHIPLNNQQPTLKLFADLETNIGQIKSEKDCKDITDLLNAFKAREGL